MANHLKFSLGFTGPLLLAPFHVLLASWVIGSGILLILLGANLFVSSTSGLGFWFFSVFFFLKDCALLEQPRPLT